MVDLLELDDGGLAEDLEGKDLAGLFFVAWLLSADEDNSCKSACGGWVSPVFLLPKCAY